MAESANVLSVDAIKRFHDALATFIEEAKHALLAVDMENRRTNDWITNRQRLYWVEEHKRRREKVGEVQSTLHRKRMRAKPGEPVHDAEEMELLRIAKARVREAEEKIEIVKRWSTAFQHAIDEYQGSSRPLADLLEGDCVRALAQLEKMSAALEEYLKLNPPSST